MFDRWFEPQQPMVAVALCFVVGLCVGWRWEVDALLLVGVLLALVGVVVVFRFRWLWYVMAMVGVVLSGMIAMSFDRSSSSGIVAEGEYSLRVLSARDVEVEASRRESGAWCGSGATLIYGCDSLLNLRRGDRVVARGRVRYFDGGGRGYIYISSRNVLEHESAPTFGARINEMLCARIDKMGLNGESSSLIKAVLLGERGELSQPITNSYRRSGAAHLLALSGLHIGIVAMILMLLLTPMIFLFRGHIWRSLLVVVLIWGYAYIVGMSSSVVRSTIMYSVLIVAPIVGRDYNSLNALSLCVLIMTLIEPMVIFDVGFQLSVLSVAAIILWAMPLWGVLRRRVGGGRLFKEFVLLPLLIGLCCTAATLPIVSHTFGYFSLFGVVLNPLLLVTTYLILALSMVWLILPFHLAAPLFRAVLEGCVWLQNSVVEFSAMGWRDAIDLRLKGLSVVLIYIGYLLLTIEFRRRLRDRR